MRVCFSVFCLFFAFQALIINDRSGGAVICDGVSSATLITGPADTVWSHAVASNDQIFISGISPTAAQIGFILAKPTNGKSPTVIAGSVIAGVKDGTGTSAGLAKPSRLVFDPRDVQKRYLYFIDRKFSNTGKHPHFIRKLDVSNGMVTTVYGNGLECGTPISPDPSDGPALQAFICALPFFVFDNKGSIYLLDDNILRFFNVEAGTVKTVVGTYRGNPGRPYEFIDSDKGKNAYLENGVSRLFVNRQQDSDLLWIWSGPYIHRVNISNIDYPVRTYPFLHVPALLGASTMTTLCQSRLNPSILYAFSDCKTSSTDNRRYSGQMVNYDLRTFNETIMAGTGLDCGITDGNNPTFRQSSDCSSFNVNGASEALLLIESIVEPGENTIIRSITIADGSNPSPTTPSPNNPHTPSSALSPFSVSKSLIALLVFITIGTFIRF